MPPKLAAQWAHRGHRLLGRRRLRVASLGQQRGGRGSCSPQGWRHCGAQREGEGASTKCGFHCGGKWKWEDRCPFCPVFSAVSRSLALGPLETLRDWCGSDLPPVGLERPRRPVFGDSSGKTRERGLDTTVPSNSFSSGVCFYLWIFLALFKFSFLSLIEITESSLSSLFLQR